MPDTLLDAFLSPVEVEDAVDPCLYLSSVTVLKISSKVRTMSFVVSRWILISTVRQ